MAASKVARSTGPRRRRLRESLPTSSCLAAVASLAREYSGPTNELYEATGGNPFLVSEALSVPDLSASAAVRDAVRVRVSRLSSDALSLAELVAVVPTQAERRLLESIGGASADLLEECRRRGLIEYDDAWVWYRHELVRTAMRDSLTPARRRELNSAILRELIAERAAARAQSAPTPASETDEGSPVSAMASATSSEATASRITSMGTSVAPLVASSMASRRCAFSSSLDLGSR